MLRTASVSRRISGTKHKGEDVVPSQYLPSYIHSVPYGTMPSNLTKTSTSAPEWRPKATLCSMGWVELGMIFLSKPVLDSWRGGIGFIPRVHSKLTGSVY